jgi:2Fe-2S ferredoxin
VRARNLIEVTYIQADGREITAQVAAGDSIMDGAVDNGIAGIIGHCGGGLTCLTCHCYVDPPWSGQIPAPGKDELELLDYVFDRKPTSRFSCQIFLCEEVSGIRVRLPKRQI